MFWSRKKEPEQWTSVVTYRDETRGNETFVNKSDWKTKEDAREMCIEALKTGFVLQVSDHERFYPVRAVLFTELWEKTAYEKRFGTND